MTLHTHIATIHTNHGDIKVNLYGLQAPETVSNFVGLADGSKNWVHPRTKEPNNGKPLYNGTIFHRVIRNFMIQGGDPQGDGTGGPGYSFRDEISELNFNEPYKLAMANAGPGTNGSQFFITVAPTTWLYGLHTVFGEVLDEESRMVVKEICGVDEVIESLEMEGSVGEQELSLSAKETIVEYPGVETDGKNRPLDPVVIDSISIEKVEA